MVKNKKKIKMLLVIAAALVIFIIIMASIFSNKENIKKDDRIDTVKDYMIASNVVEINNQKITLPCRLL